MTQNGTYKQSVKWLYEQLAQQESKLSKAEAFTAQLRASVGHLRGVLEIVAFNEAKLTPPEALPQKEASILNGRESVSSIPVEDELHEDQMSKLFLDYNLFDEENPSNPQDIKQPESLSKKVAEAAESILHKHQKSQELKSILNRARRSSAPLSHQ